MKELEILVLGAGWTSTFLIPLLKESSISFAATTTTGRDDTIKFKFDPSASDQSSFHVLPTAKTILITFPLKGKGPSTLLTTTYKSTHPKSDPRFLQLGSTGIWQIPDQPLWLDRHSNYDLSNDRAVAEDELLRLGGCVLNLSGLWGGARQPRNFVGRVASSKAQVKAKTSLHMVHGRDVARAIVAVHRDFTPGERWMVTDGFVYDWWALFVGWGNGGANGRDEDVQGELAKWVFELMGEEGVRALPRSMEAVGRCYDTREFWTRFGLQPVRARI